MLEPDPELEMAQWFRLLRKRGLKLTQKELSLKCGISLGTLQQFERTGDIGLPEFLRIARELHALDLFLSLARNEEPVTFHKIQKDKAISRLKDQLALANGETTPVELRKKNSHITGILEKPKRWRLAGREDWIATRREP
jgi:transcriptional regulator with XRE-family HTH domain